MSGYYYKNKRLSTASFSVCSFLSDVTAHDKHGGNMHAHPRSLWHAERFYIAIEVWFCFQKQILDDGIASAPASLNVWIFTIPDAVWTDT